MKRKIIFISDTHLFGPGEVFLTEGLSKEQVFAKFLIFTRMNQDDLIAFLGDIIDMKNCPRARISDANWVLNKIKNHFQFYTRGNHEYDRGIGLPVRHFMPENIVIEHGHRVFDRKFIKWELKSPKGLPKWKFKLYEAINIIRDMFAKRKISKKDIKKFRAYYKKRVFIYDPKAFIIGHKHPRSFLKFYDKKNGVLYCITPKGRKSFFLSDFLKLI